MKTQRWMLRRKGFTLIELLVVIAIIAIIAAILFPVFASAREKARQTACLSNSKQLGLALAQYEQDFDEMTPCGTYQYGGGAGWGSQVFGYVKSVGVFECPDDTLAANPTVSYAINYNLAPEGVQYVAHTQIGTLISQFTSPARTILFCEVVNNTLPGHTYTLPNETDANSIPSSPQANGTGVCADPAGNNMYNCNNATNQPLTTTSMKYATGWLYGMAPGITGTNTANFTGQYGHHNGGSNYIFADCHAKWLPGTRVSGGYTTSASWAPVCGGYNAGPGAWYAALTTCPDNIVAATWNWR